MIMIIIKSYSGTYIIDNVNDNKDDDNNAICTCIMKINDNKKIMMIIFVVDTYHNDNN